MSYQDQLEEQSSAVVEQVLAALAMWEAGKLTTEALIAVAAAFIAAGNSAAAVLADLSLAAAVTVQTGTAVPPIGLTRPADEPERLTRAVTTIVEKPEQALMRLERLADSEVKQAAARSYSAAVARSSRVTGWTRGLKADACQLCRWWSREGRVWDSDRPMPTHKGCTCSQLITTTERKSA